MQKVRKWLSIFVIAIFVLSPFVFVSGCAGTFLSSPEKQNAYKDYVTKFQELGESQGRLDQLETSINGLIENSDIDFNNTAEVYTELGKYSASMDIYVGELDVFISDCDNATAASQKYRTYLDQDSTSYKQLLNNETEIAGVAGKARDLRELCISTKALLTEMSTWMQKMTALLNKFYEADKLQTGSEIYAWFMTTRPVLDGYIAESNILVSMTDDTIRLAQKNGLPSDSIISLQQMKNSIISGNTQIISSYNGLADIYNSQYGSAFGIVPKA